MCGTSAAARERGSSTSSSARRMGTPIGRGRSTVAPPGRGRGAGNVGQAATLPNMATGGGNIGRGSRGRGSIRGYGLFHASNEFTSFTVRNILFSYQFSIGFQFHLFFKLKTSFFPCCRWVVAIKE